MPYELRQTQILLMAVLVTFSSDPATGLRTRRGILLHLPRPSRMGQDTELQVELYCQGWMYKSLVMTDFLDETHCDRNWVHWTKNGGKLIVRSTADRASRTCIDGKWRALVTVTGKGKG